MTISFTQIPADRMIPLFAAEFVSTAPEQVGALMKPTLLLGQKLPAASAVASTRYLISSNGEAIDLFGAGSPLHLMCKRFLQNNPAGKVYAAAQTDAGASTAASQTLAFTGPATGDGTIYLYIGGKLVEVGVSDGDSITTIGDAVDAAVLADDELPVTSANAAGTVTFTAKVKGTVGNQITLAVNPLGQAGGQVLPDGVGATLGAATLASGATDPTVANWTTSLGDEAFDLIVLQFAATAALDELQTTLTTRWGATVATDGVLIAAEDDSAGDLETLVEGYNDEHISIVGFKESASWLSPAYEVAAAYAGVVARYCVESEDPGQSVQMQPLLGIWGRGTNFSDTERDGLANAGCATLKNDRGTCYIELEATTKRTTEFGDPDTRFQDIQVPLSMAYLRRYYKSLINSAYPRHKLADDDTAIPSGARVVTPAIAKAFVIAKYKALEGVLVEDVDAFSESVIVERNATNPNRLDGYIEPNFINRLRVFAMQIAQRG